VIALHIKSLPSKRITVVTDRAGDKWRNVGQKDFSYMMEDSEKDYEITFSELSSWVEQIWFKNPAHVKNVYAYTVVKCICMCNADFHIFQETNISFL